MAIRLHISDDLVMLRGVLLGGWHGGGMVDKTAVQGARQCAHLQPIDFRHQLQAHVRRGSRFLAGYALFAFTVGCNVF